MRVMCAPMGALPRLPVLLNAAVLLALKTVFKVLLCSGQCCCFTLALCVSLLLPWVKLTMTHSATVLAAAVDLYTTFHVFLQHQSKPGSHIGWHVLSRRHCYGGRD